MKSLALLFTILVSIPSLADTNADFVSESLTKAQQMLGISNQKDRNDQLCALLTERIGSAHIAPRLLGTYENLSRDQAAIDQFHHMVPSIMMSTILPLLGPGGANVTIVVDPNSRSRGNDIYEVGVTFKNNGRDYLGTAVVKSGGPLTLIDAEYQGKSAVEFQGKSYQKFLDRRYNADPVNSMPVSDLVQNISEQEDYIACP